MTRLLARRSRRVDPDGAGWRGRYRRSPRYKPRVGESTPDEDPAVLIREVLAIEGEITKGLEKLLTEIES